MFQNQTANLRQKSGTQSLTSHNFKSSEDMKAMLGNSSFGIMMHFGEFLETDHSHDSYEVDLVGME